MAAGVVPQSSCSFRPMRAGANLLAQRLGVERVALAEKAEVQRERLGRFEHPPDVPRARRAGGGVGAGRRTGAAADERRDAASGTRRESGCGEMKWMCVSMPPAVRIRPSPAITSVAAPITRPGVTPSMMPGVARLADRRDAPVADADVGLVDARRVDDHALRDDEIGRAAVARRRSATAPCRRESPCRRRTSPRRRRRRSRARSGSIRSVSARRMRSPVVGP